MNKKFAYGLLAGLLALLCIAAMPTSVNFNQFGSGGVLYITNGAPLTNPATRGLSNLTFVVNSGSVTNSTNTFTGGTNSSSRLLSTNGIVDQSLTVLSFTFANASKQIVSSTNLTETTGVLSTKSIFSTNNQDFAVLNVRYTNGPTRAFVSGTIECETGTFGASDGFELIIENVSKTNSYSVEFQENSTVSQKQLCGMVGPNAVFYFTNSFGGQDGGSVVKSTIIGF